MKETTRIIKQAFDQYRPAVAFSGGGDSMVLLDIICSMGYKPPVYYVDSQMEYNSGLGFAKDVANRYGLKLHHAKAPITPQECWGKHGFPMLGKLAARKFMQTHRGEQSSGFKIDVSTCCRKMKIKPGRDMIKEIQCNASFTGLRGNTDDALRGMRAIKDGPIKYVKADKIYQISPLLGWTDLMIKRYTENHKLPINPMRKAGAKTIGCMYCGGGAQFDNSGFRVLRKIDAKEWRKMIIDFGFGPIIISIKYDVHIDVANAALDKLGGISHVCDLMPHVFDFLRIKPMKGYVR